MLRRPEVPKGLPEEPKGLPEGKPLLPYWLRAKDLNLGPPGHEAGSAGPQSPPFKHLQRLPCAVPA